MRASSYRRARSNRFLELSRDLAVQAVIGSLLSRQASQTEMPVQRYPTLSGSERDSRRRDRLQPTVIFQEKVALDEFSRSPPAFN